MRCKECKSKELVKQQDWHLFLCDECATKRNCEMSPNSSMVYPKFSRSNVKYTLYNSILLPFRVVWNVFIIICTVAAFISWIGFIFGSVVGVILLLIFFPTGFLLPINILVCMVEVWPKNKNV